MASSSRGLGRGRGWAQFLGQREQAVGLAAHRRGHDHHLVAGAHPLGHALRHVADALGGAHRGAAVLVNDQCHEGLPERGKKGSCRETQHAAHRAAANRDSSGHPACSAAAWTGVRAPSAASRADGPARPARAHPGPGRARRPGPVRVEQRPAARPGRHALRLVLLLQARAPGRLARAGSARRPPAAAVRPRAAGAAAGRPRRRLDAQLPAQGGSACGRGPGPCQGGGRAVRLDRAAAGTVSAGQLAAVQPQLAARRGQRALRARGSSAAGAAAAIGQPAAVARAASGAGTAAAPGGSGPARRRSAAGRLHQRRRSSAASSSISAALPARAAPRRQRGLGVGKGLPVSAGHSAAAAGCARSAVSALLGRRRSPAGAGHVGFDGLARLVQPGPQPRSAVALCLVRGMAASPAGPAPRRPAAAGLGLVAAVVGQQHGVAAGLARHRGQRA
jgi:hypothetical protein